MAPELTLALERYDRHIPFFMDMIEQPEEFKIKALEVGMAPPRREGIDRHRRFYEDEEFDICEMSLSSYLTSKGSSIAYSAVPVFPRRLFSQNHIFISSAANISKPTDLIGKKAICRSFQTTMSVLAKGDLFFEYGVPWRELDWHTMSPELVSFQGQEEVKLSIIDEPTAPERLIAGEFAMMIHPHPPPKLLQGLRIGKVHRLWPDVRKECGHYFQKYGDYPIMHLLVFKKTLADLYPELPKTLMVMWKNAKEQAAEFYDDPGYSEVAFARNAFEEEQEMFGCDPWPTGVMANKNNIERFMDYLVDQTLLNAPIPIEELFHSSVLNS